MHEHRPFMESVIQTLLSSTEYRGIVAWVSLTLRFWLCSHCPFQREFTLLLFPLLSRKLRRSMPSLLPHPPLLAHTIYQALVFDAAVAEDGFSLAGTSAAGENAKWDGVSDVILGKEEWFAAWMDGEKQCECTSSLVYLLLIKVLPSCRGPVPRDHRGRRCLAHRRRRGGRRIWPPA
jgi:hypothetical protein